MPDVTESLDVVEAILGDEVYVFTESERRVKSNTKEFDVISKSYSGASNIHTGDVRQSVITLICTQEDGIRLFWIESQPVLREPGSKSGQARLK
jgi:hypothetical protein